MSALTAQAVPFQFLIGRLDTHTIDEVCILELAFQFLIGRLDTGTVLEAVVAEEFSFNSS